MSTFSVRLLRGQPAHNRLFPQGCPLRPERRISLHKDAILLAEVDQLGLREGERDLDLVHGRLSSPSETRRQLRSACLDFSYFEQLLNAPDGPVRDADVLDQAFALQSFQGFPRRSHVLAELFVEEQGAVLVAREPLGHLVAVLVRFEGDGPVYAILA
jgi:hypothetical protein